MKQKGPFQLDPSGSRRAEGSFLYNGDFMIGKVLSQPTCFQFDGVHCKICQSNKIWLIWVSEHHIWLYSVILLTNGQPTIAVEKKIVQLFGHSARTMCALVRHKNSLQMVDHPDQLRRERKKPTKTDGSVIVHVPCVRHIALCALMRQKSPRSQTVRPHLWPPGRLLQCPASGLYKRSSECSFSISLKLVYFINRTHYTWFYEIRQFLQTLSIQATQNDLIWALSKQI